MDVTKYKDIAPYRGQDVRDAIKRVLENKDAMYKMLASLGPAETAEQQKKLSDSAAYIAGILEKVETYDDFQQRITAGIFLCHHHSKECKHLLRSRTEHTSKDVPICS